MHCDRDDIIAGMNDMFQCDGRSSGESASAVRGRALRVSSSAGASRRKEKSFPAVARGCAAVWLFVFMSSGIAFGSDVSADEAHAVGLSGGAWMGDGVKNGEVRTIALPCGATMDLVWVEPGTFEMGSNGPDADKDERPVHAVTLEKGYWIGKTEVTQKQWKSVMGNNPSRFKGDELPVEGVSWNDCLTFLKKVYAVHPEYRLTFPTEAQWEFAARGGTARKGYEYSGSGDLGEVAWYGENARGWFSFMKTHCAGTKKPNELGLCDMSGNVWEWCADRYGVYPSGPVVDPTGPDSGDRRVRRGGSWHDFAVYCRSTSRDWVYQIGRSDSTGFRVAAFASASPDLPL